jgi:putative transposase
MKHTKPYPSDMTEAQWLLIKAHVPAAKAGGRPRTTDMRAVVNGILYLTREGCSWRALPHDFPPWKTVYNYFAAWKSDDTWDNMLHALRHQARARVGRADTPSVCCVDSQSVKSACGGEAIGTDGNKRVKGRKRHILTDALGLLLAVVVTAANADDGETAPELFRKLPAAEWRRLRTVFGDNKYHNGTFEAYLAERKLRLEVSSKPPGEPKFKPLKIRWVVEQALGCMGRWRRLSKDYEKTTASSEAVVKVSAIHRLLRRLSPRYQKQIFHYKRPQKVNQSGPKR